MAMRRDYRSNFSRGRHQRFPAPNSYPAPVFNSNFDPRFSPQFQLPYPPLPPFYPRVPLNMPPPANPKHDRYPALLPHPAPESFTVPAANAPHMSSDFTQFNAYPPPPAEFADVEDQRNVEEHVPTGPVLRYPPSMAAPSRPQRPHLHPYIHPSTFSDPWSYLTPAPLPPAAFNITHH